MYKNILLMRNGCEGCPMKTCLGVLLAESLHAKVTAAYVTGDFTWRELRRFYGLDELKWAGVARVGKDAMAVAEGRKAGLAKEALESTGRMCADRGIPCEAVHLSCGSPLDGVLKFAEEKRCDMIVTSTHPRGLKDLLSDARDAKKLGTSKIPVLFHHAI